MALLPRSHERYLVQKFREQTHSSLANPVGQLHAQDKLEGGEFRFWCVKGGQTVRHGEPGDGRVGGGGGRRRRRRVGQYLDFHVPSTSQSTQGEEEGVSQLVSQLVIQLVGALSPVNHKGLYQGLKENFTERYIVERTKKAEIRPEEQSVKLESCWENLWNEIKLKLP